jgi:hypothetical protein
MAIPSSPSEISLGQLRVEFVNTATDDYALRRVGGPTSSGFAGATDPPQFTPINQNSTYKPDMVAEYAMSEWYRYDHSEYGYCSIVTFTTPNIGKFFTYYKIEVTGDDNSKVRVMVTPLGIPNVYTYVNVYTVYPFNDDGTLIPDFPEVNILTAGSYADAIYTKDGVNNEFFHVVIFEASEEIYTNVFINLCAGQYTDSNGNLNVNLRSTTLFGYVGGPAVILNTAVSVLVTVLIDNSLYSDRVSISAGNSTSSYMFLNLPPGALVLNAAMSQIDLNGYSDQKYIIGQSLVGNC